MMACIIIAIVPIIILYVALPEVHHRGRHRRRRQGAEGGIAYACKRHPDACVQPCRGLTAIGTLGREAYRFVDFLAEAGQSYWQILPIGPHRLLGTAPTRVFPPLRATPISSTLTCWRSRACWPGMNCPAPQPAGPIRYDCCTPSGPPSSNRRPAGCWPLPSPGVHGVLPGAVRLAGRTTPLFMAIKEEQGQARAGPAGPTAALRAEPAALAGRPPAPGRPLRLLQGRPVLLLQPVDRPESLRQRQGHPPDRGTSPSTSAPTPAICGRGPNCSRPTARSA